MNSQNPLYQSNNIISIIKGRIPGQLIIQITDQCNATCPQCSMRKTELFKRSKISEAEVLKMIDAASNKNIQALSFTGGEPFLDTPSLMRMLQYASSTNIPYIRTGTNGFMFMDSDNANFKDKISRFAEELSKTRLRNFWISIDSAEAKTHEQMRGLQGVIRGIEKALPIFHSYGIYPAANLGINRNTGGAGKISMKMTDRELFYEEFREAFEQFYQFIINLGFTMVNSCYPMSVDPENNQDMNAVYGATSVNPIITFTKEEKVELFQALMDTIPNYRSKIRIFTPLVSLYSLIKYYKAEDCSLPCRGGTDFFFVDANDGNTYPCGYRGNENIGKFYNLKIKSIKEKPYCKACDWECFRDPSELIGHFINSVQHPLRYLTDSNKDTQYRALWKSDIKYYLKCDFFDGRKATRIMT
jgi:MoaA/NifB/PqqE/SkfB family radical SAM enzyme